MDDAAVPEPQVASSDPAPAPAPATGFPAPAYVPVGRLYARACQLALLRDPLQSWVVPFFLLLPYTVLDALLPEPREVFADLRLLSLFVAGGLLGLLTTLIITAMLRVRCAVQVTGGRVHGLDAYARGAERLPALLVTEIVRSLAIGAATILFVVPGVVLSQRLSVATESVVLSEPTMAAGFQRSFELTRGRFGAWLRMVLLALLVFFVALIGASIVYALLSIAGQDLAASLAVAPFASACLAVVQYAWVFYYLELGGRVSALPPSSAVGPAYHDLANP